MYMSTKGGFLTLRSVIQLLSYLINRGPQLPPG